MHAVDVSPDLDFVGGDGSADERGGIVGATTSEVIDFAVGIATDKTLSDEEGGVRVLIEEEEESLFDVAAVGFVVVIDAHEVEGRDKDGIDAKFKEVEVKEGRGEEFTLSDNDSFLEVGEGMLLGGAADAVKDVIKEVVGLLSGKSSGEKLGEEVGVFEVEICDGEISAVGIVVIKEGGNLKEGVGGAGHGGEDDDVSIVSNKLRDIFDTLRGAYGGAAKLQDFHRDSLRV
jgi:hypothetical protein